MLINREFSLKWLIVAPIVGVMLIGTTIQIIAIKKDISAVQATLAVAEQKNAAKIITAEYQATFDNNSALTQIVMESSGLKKYLAENDVQKLQARLNEIFITNFALQNFTEIGIFNLKNQYLVGSSVTSDFQLLRSNFNNEMNEVGKTKTPYYAVRCDNKNSCTGYSIVPLMQNGKDVGYAIAGFQAVFLQFINNYKISITRSENNATNSKNRFVFQPPKIYFPPDIWINVDIGNDESSSTIKTLELNLLISSLVESLIIVMLIYFLLSHQARNIAELSKMVTSLTTGDKKDFSALIDIRSRRKIKSEEVTQLEKSILLLEQKQTEVVNEQTRRKAAECIASEKRNALNQATREFESVRQNLANSLHNEQFQRIIFSIDACNSAIKPSEKNNTTNEERFSFINTMLLQMKTHLLDVVDELYPTAIAHGIYHALQMELNQIKIRHMNSCTISWAIEECISDTTPIIQRILYLTVKESIENAIKHAEPKTIDILIWCENKKVNGTITNNGNGNDYSIIARSGKGLAEMESLINRINGSFSVQSSEQAGTEINFSIPV
jgi:signal transduction histidine kinase